MNAGIQELHLSNNLQLVTCPFPDIDEMSFDLRAGTSTGNYMTLNLTIEDAIRVVGALQHNLNVIAAENGEGSTNDEQDDDVVNILRDIRDILRSNND